LKEKDVWQLLFISFQVVDRLGKDCQSSTCILSSEISSTLRSMKGNLCNCGSVANGKEMKRYGHLDDATAGKRSMGSCINDLPLTAYRSFGRMRVYER